jgi:hypothetical protein
MAKIDYQAVAAAAAAVSARPGAELGLLPGSSTVARLAAERAKLEVMVSRPFPSWNRSTLTEIYLCHACSEHEIEEGITKSVHID